jgi:hypothetical protein
MKNASNEHTSGCVVVRVRSPRGVVPRLLAHARRLDGLKARTIAELSNGMWEDQRIFPAIRDALQKRFPDLNIIPFTEFPIGSEQIDKESVIDRLLQKGCEAVIVGNAA